MMLMFILLCNLAITLTVGNTNNSVPINTKQFEEIELQLQLHTELSDGIDISRNLRLSYSFHKDYPDYNPNSNKLDSSNSEQNSAESRNSKYVELIVPKYSDNNKNAVLHEQLKSFYNLNIKNEVRKAGRVISVHSNSNNYGNRNGKSYSNSVLDTVKVQALQEFHTALRTGSLHEETDINSDSFDNRTKLLLESIQELLDQYEPCAFIEHYDKTDSTDNSNSVIPYNGNSKKPLSYYISNWYPGLLSVFFNEGKSSNADDDDSSNNSNEEDIIEIELYHNMFTYQPSNIYLVRPMANKENALPDKYSCVQTILDLDIMRYDLLPFEYENTFGKLLCRCKYTYLPLNLPDTNYFSFWGSMKALVDSAIASVKTCAVTDENLDNKSSFARELKRSHMIVIRNETDAHGDFNSDFADATPTFDHNRPPYSSSSRYSSSRYSSKGTLGKMEAGSVGSSSAVTDSTVLKKVSSCSEYITVAALKSLPLYDTTKKYLSSAIARYYSNIASSVISIRDYSTIFNTLVQHGSEVTRLAECSILLMNDKTLVDDDKDGGDTTINNTTSTVHTSTKYERPVRTTEPKEAGIIISNTTSTMNTNVEDGSGVSHRRLGTVRSPRSKKKTYLYRSNNPTKVFSVDENPVLLDIDYQDSSSGDPVDDKIVSAIKSIGYDSSLISEQSKSSKKLNTNIFELFHSQYKNAQRLLHNREDTEYRRWMKSLKFGNEIKAIKEAKVVYIYGSRLSLLSVKLSELLAKQKRNEIGIVVSIVDDPLSIVPHQNLQQIMNINNNILCHRPISTIRLLAIASIQETADINIIESSIIIKLLIQSCANVNHHKCDYNLFEESMSVLIGTGLVTFIEFPPYDVVKNVINGLPKDCIEVLLDRYSTVDSMITRIVSSDNVQSSRSILKLKLSTSFQATSVYKVSLKADNSVERKSGISIKSLVKLGIVDHQKKHLLNMLMGVPMWMLNNRNAEGGRIPSMMDDLMLLARRVKTKVMWSLVIKKLESNDLTRGIDYSVITDKLEGNKVYRIISRELKEHQADLSFGKFSFLNYGSNFGYFTTRLAIDFPNATIISLERDLYRATHAYNVSNALAINNSMVCNLQESDTTVLKNIYDSPELFRYQYQSSKQLLSLFTDSINMEAWGNIMGLVLSIAITSFLTVPSSAQVSWIMYSIYGQLYYRDNNPFNKQVADEIYVYSVNGLGADLADDSFFDHDTKQIVTQLNSLNTLQNHPQVAYQQFELTFLLHNTRVAAGGSTSVKFQTIPSEDDNQISVVRSDIVNMTRYVHHHYDYKRDGHKRTYTMRVFLNDSLTSSALEMIQDLSKAVVSIENNALRLSKVQEESGGLDQLESRYGFPHPLLRDDNINATFRRLMYSEQDSILLPLGSHTNNNHIVSVNLYRDSDTFPIPYTSIYGVTLISLIRLGLLESQRDKLFELFIRLPLYEDMAPWNIVIMGDVSIRDTSSHIEISSNLFILRDWITLTMTPRSLSLMQMYPKLIW